MLVCMQCGKEVDTRNVHTCKWCNQPTKGILKRDYQELEKALKNLFKE